MIGVYGMGHLGSVTAACLSVAGFTVNAIPCRAIDREFAPEPGLAGMPRDLIVECEETPAAFVGVDLLWVTIDTPLSMDERPQVWRTVEAIERAIESLSRNAVVLISSQVTVGTTRELAARCSQTIVYSPENIRHGRGIERFQNQARIVVGTMDGKPNPAVASLLGRFCGHLMWMTYESAEMVKHALNGYLATMIVFGNEIGDIAAKAGADVRAIEAALLSEERVSPQAPLRSGGPFTGGTLARELKTLTSLASADLLFSAVYEANRRRL